MKCLSASFPIRFLSLVRDVQPQYSGSPAVSWVTRVAERSLTTFLLCGGRGALWIDQPHEMSPWRGEGKVHLTAAFALTTLVFLAVGISTGEDWTLAFSLLLGNLPKSVLSRFPPPSHHQRRGPRRFPGSAGSVAHIDIFLVFPRSTDRRDFSRFFGHMVRDPTTPTKVLFFLNGCVCLFI